MDKSGMYTSTSTSVQKYLDRQNSTVENKENLPKDDDNKNPSQVATPSTFPPNVPTIEIVVNWTKFGRKATTVDYRVNALKGIIFDEV
jgi:hypothetical protein